MMRPRDTSLFKSPHSLLLDRTAEPSSPQGLDLKSLFPEIIGRSSAMAEVLATVSKIARSDGSVLILGESGTGKELIASAIHRLSHRSHKPYVPLNCSAIPDNLLESELFGHEKGAFTGADKKAIGKFQFADGGSIFLDEIGDMPALLQAKLLRVLQDKRIAPLGSNKLSEVDVRVIAATNMNLEDAIKQGSFRRDLFYRLNVLPVVLPPLRERREDIPALLQHFLDLKNREYGFSAPCYLEDGLISFFCQYEWPGNIRQLEHLVERLVVIKGGGNITLHDLPHEIQREISQAEATVTPVKTNPTLPLARPIDRSVITPAKFGELPQQGIDLVKFIEDLENSLIIQALERTGHNRNQAAKLLGLNRTTLVERIKKRQIIPLNEPSREL